MKRIIIALAAAIAAIAATAPAVADEALAKEKKCSSCHAMDKTKVGPSYKAIAKQRKGDKDAEAKMVSVIMKGGKGSFGDQAMPAMAGVSEAEAKKLASWILSVK